MLLRHCGHATMRDEESNTISQGKNTHLGSVVMNVTRKASWT